ncbi:phospholipase D-like domain-containing protein [Nocardioides iriomotensis]|nr:phosphatidylserine/phosphatidylglycerophosphate/cardiolipin synthase family protein [Nocardioides iriomotensis]
MSLVGTVAASVSLALTGPALMIGGNFPGYGTLRGDDPPDQVTAAVLRADPAPETGGHVSFNDPTGDHDQQFALVDRIDRAIASSSRDATIRLAAYSFAMPSTSEALVRAHARGVNVRVVVDDHSAHWGSVRRLEKALGTDTSAQSFVKVCKLSCRGGRGNQHAKFVTISDGTWGRKGNLHDNLVLVGSLNLTNFSSQRQWNDLYMASDREAHDQLADVFRGLVNDTPQPRMRLGETGTGFATDVAPYRVSSRADDPIESRLARVRCQGASLVSGDHGRTVIRISMHAWNGDRGIVLARQVARLHRRGCDVKVLYGVGMGRVVANTLRDAGVPIRDSKGADGRRVHHKVMVLSGVLGRQTDANYVWTGSHNWSDRSLRNDEIMFRISGRALVQAYLANFRTIWKVAKP